MKFWKAFYDERTLAVLVLASGIFIGLAVPAIADFLHPWALPALFLVIVFSLVPFARLPVPELFSITPEMTRIVLWQQVVLPCIVIAAGIVARFPDSIILLMIVSACSGSLFSSPALAEILQLDRQRALQAMVLSSLFMPVSLFLFLSAFRGTQANPDFVAYVMRTLVFLVIPFALLTAWRPIAKKMDEATTLRVSFAARWATIVALLVFGTGLMSVVSDRLASDPSKVLFLLVLAALLCGLMMGLTTIVMYRFGHREALTASIVAGFRNIGLGFALVGEMLGSDLAVYAGISLLPVFVAPLFLRFSLAAPTAGGSTGSPASEPEPHSPY